MSWGCLQLDDEVVWRFPLVDDVIADSRMVKSYYLNKIQEWYNLYKDIPSSFNDFCFQGSMDYSPQIEHTYPK